MKKWLIGFLVFCAVLTLYANWGFEKKINQVQAFPVSCLEGWAHRGYVNPKLGIEENSLASYQKAIELGAAGIEMDVLYDVELDDFIVSHDTPYHTQEDGSFLHLQQALQTLPEIHVWLDAKNLSGLWPWQASKATKRLSEILKASLRTKQVLVESRHPIYLSWLAEQGIHTTLMISPNPKANPLSMWAVIIASKLYFLMGDFSGVSTGFLRYTDAVQESFQSIPAYLSTVNDQQTIEAYKQQPQIKVFLTDNPDLYGLHCN
jgi:hypothetical protein